MTNKEVNEKIQKLLRLASNNPSESEARAAMLKAQELMLKYHVENPETIDTDTVVKVFFDLGNRQKDEFTLLLSVVVANNFRCKTMHAGQKIYFFGFTADAQAAMQVYVFLLNFSETMSQRHFNNDHFTKQALEQWKNGFSVGLYQAFASRVGVEIMVTVPEKVLEICGKIQSQPLGKDEMRSDRSMSRHFLDGVRRGKESLGHREIVQHA